MLNSNLIETAQQTPATSAPMSSTTASERMNSKCFCVSLDEAALRDALASELGSPELLALVEERCPFLFSARPVFISNSQTELDSP